MTKGFALIAFEYNKALYDFEDVLEKAGFDQFDNLWVDEYDSSIEFGEVDNNARLSDEAQRIIYEAGFIRAFLNHKDGTETHYNWDWQKPFEPVPGWRRQRTEEGVNINYWPPKWPDKLKDEWLGTYMKIVPDL